MLWALLDIIAATTIILQGGNYFLPLGYVIGATSVTVLLAAKRQASWSGFETFITVLVISCMVIWYLLGNRAATIASVTAISLASIPQVVATFRDPRTTPTLVYLAFCMANTLSFVGGKSWSVEEKLYSGAALFFCAAITLLSVRRPQSVHR